VKRKIYLVLGLLCVLLVLAATRAPAQSYPDVGELKPFSAETNYMSRAGYMRWQVYTASGIWLSMMEARRILKAQDINPDA